MSSGADEELKEAHVHACANPTGLCPARGYCECFCGQRRYANDTSRWVASPPSASEITEAIRELERASRSTTPLAEAATHAARSRLESLYLEQLQEIENRKAQSSLDHAELCELGATICALKDSQLTPEEAQIVLTYYPDMWPEDIIAKLKNIAGSTKGTAEA